MGWKPDYVTVDELKAEVLKITYDTDDAWAARVVAAASRAVDRHCRRQFGLLDVAAEVRCPASYRAERGRWVVTLPDLMTTAGLVVEVAGGTVADGYLLEPSAAAIEGEPWTHLALPYGAVYAWVDGEREAAVTGRWGWSTVPATVATATLLQAQRFYMRRDSWAGVAGSPDLGSEIRLLSKVDPDVGVMLTDYMRPAAPA